MLSNTRKGLALLTILALIVTGTFAMKEIIKANNEFIGVKKEGGADKPVLHDDFDPDAGMKDIYVENLGETNLYIRVKLSEAMNLTSHTWRPGSGDLIAHVYGSAPENCGHANAEGKKFHDYFTWTMGGWKYYKPASGTSSTVNDTNKYTEADFNNSALGIEKTLNAKIITAKEFLGMGKAEQKAFIGWIYDTDGYAYWSQVLKPNTATGLLLHGVATSPSLKNTEYYYVINVLVEAVDRADIPMWTEGKPSVNENDKETLPVATEDGKEVIIIIVGDCECDDTCDETCKCGCHDWNNGGGNTGGDCECGDDCDETCKCGCHDWNNGGSETEIALKTPGDPDLGYRSRITMNRQDEGGWFTSPDRMTTVVMDEPGAFRLEDILVNMADADGLQVTPVNPKYNGMFSIGSARTFSCPERADKLSILYTVLPDKDTAIAQWEADRESLFPITAQLNLETKDGRKATITVTMEYYWALVGWVF